MRHQDGPEAEGMGADPGVQRADRRAGFFKRGPGLAVGIRRTLVEIGDLQRQKKFVQSLTSLARR